MLWLSAIMGSGKAASWKSCFKEVMQRQVSPASGASSTAQTLLPTHDQPGARLQDSGDSSTTHILESGDCKS